MSTKKDKFSFIDKFYMELALDLARAREGHTGTNPSVGCIIVKNDKIVSEETKVMYEARTRQHQKDKSTPAARKKWTIDKVGSICTLNYKVGSISKFLHCDWFLSVKVSDWFS